MKRVLFSTLLTVLIVVLCLTLLPAQVDAAAYSGTCGENLTWTLDSNGVLTISGTGDMEDYDYSTRPWYSNRSAVTTVMIENGVTSMCS